MSDPRQRRRLTIALVLAVTLTAAVAGAAPRALEPSKVVVHVIARDYALEAPDTVRAGDVGFELGNRGTQYHELLVGLLRPGATAGDIVAAHQRGVTLRQLSQAYLAEGVSGALLAAPGTRSPAQLIVPLQQGRDYVLLCQLRDSVGKPPHAVLGMFRLLHAR
jgi:hypothetical protein